MFINEGINLIEINMRQWVLTSVELMTQFKQRMDEQ